jgi:hypothetical protein
VIEKASMTTNPEAKIQIYETIIDVLVSLAVEDDATDEDIDQTAEEMSELADILMENLGLEVDSVEEDGSIKVTLRLYEGNEDDQQA